MAFNKLNPSQVERLACLAEELGEAQQVIGKILRHGYDSFHPNSPTTANRELLERELGDVLAIIWFMDFRKDVNFESVNHYAADKIKRIQPFLHHNDVKAMFDVINPTPTPSHGAPIVVAEKESGDKYAGKADHESAGWKPS